MAGLPIVLSSTKPIRPTEQCAKRGADGHHGNVPHEDVRGLKVRAMELEHAQAGQTGQSAGGQSCGNGPRGKAAAKQQPAQQSCGRGMEEAGEQARNAGRDKVIGVVVAEKDREYSKQSGGAERQKRSRRSAEAAGWNHLRREAARRQPRENDKRGKNQQTFEQAHPCNPEKARAYCAGQSNGGANSHHAGSDPPCGRQRSDGAHRRSDRVADVREDGRIGVLRSPRRLTQNIVDLVLFHKGPPLLDFPVRKPIVSRNFL